LLFDLEEKNSETAKNSIIKIMVGWKGEEQTQIRPWLHCKQRVFNVGLKLSILRVGFRREKILISWSATENAGRPNRTFL